MPEETKEEKLARLSREVYEDLWRVAVRMNTYSDMFQSAARVLALLYVMRGGEKPVAQWLVDLATYDGDLAMRSMVEVAVNPEQRTPPNA